MAQWKNVPPRDHPPHLAPIQPPFLPPPPPTMLAPQTLYTPPPAAPPSSVLHTSPVAAATSLSLPPPPSLLTPPSTASTALQSSSNPSSHDDPSAHPSKPKQRRYRATPAQLAELLVIFEQNPSPTQADLGNLSAAIGMPQQSVVLWFKNRRARVPNRRTPTSPHAQYFQTPLPTPPPPPPPPLVPQRVSRRVAEAVASSLLQPPLPPLAPAPTDQPRPAPERHYLTTPFYHAGVTKVVPPSYSLRAAPTSYSTPYGVSHVYPPPPSRRHGRPHPYGASRERDEAQAARDVAATLVGLSCEKPEGLHPLWGRPEVRIPEVRDVVPEAVEEHCREPVTPRISSQRVYFPGDRVEVLEEGDSSSRAWLPAVVCEKRQGGGKRAEPLCLGANAAESAEVVEEGDYMPGSTPVTPAEDGGHIWKKEEEEEEKENVGVKAGVADSGYQVPVLSEVRQPSRQISPPEPSVSTSQSLAASRAQYIVECMGVNRTEVTREVVSASRCRPEPPVVTVGEGAGEWLPQIGHAVEVLDGSTWRIAEARSSQLHPQGIQTRSESGVLSWVPFDRIRPYRKWQGCSTWAASTKLPVTLMKHASKYGGVSSVMVSDSDADSDDSEAEMARHLRTAPYENLGDDECSAAAASAPMPSPVAASAAAIVPPRLSTRKRGRAPDPPQPRIVAAKPAPPPPPAEDENGPDGLPAGWRVERVERAAGILAGRVDQFYVAPDGRRHRSLREALRYASRA